MVKATYGKIEDACATQQEIEFDLQDDLEDVLGDEQIHLASSGNVQYNLESLPSYHDEPPPPYQLICPNTVVQAVRCNNARTHRVRVDPIHVKYIKYCTNRLQSSMNHIEQVLTKDFTTKVFQAIHETGSAPVVDELDIAILDLLVRAEETVSRLQAFLDSLPDMYKPEKMPVARIWTELARKDRSRTITRVKDRLSEEDAKGQLDVLRAHQAEWNRKRTSD